jgi:hypothetical protein
VTSDLHFFERRENMNKGDFVNEVSKVVKTKKDAQAPELLTSDLQLALFHFDRNSF